LRDFGGSQKSGGHGLEQMGSLDGVMITTDAAHTQVQTAQRIVMENGADYLLPLKGNQHPNKS